MSALMGAPIVNDCISSALVIVQSLPDANIRRTPILSQGRIERAMNAAQQDRSAPVNAPSVRDVARVAFDAHTKIAHNRVK
jgi:hypothetical protein